MECNDRRAMRRFDLKLPCLTAPTGRDGGMDGEWVTLNISAGGAFINAVNVLSVGTRLEIQILVPSTGGRISDHGGAVVQLCGEVVRADAMGTALEFDDQYYIFQMGKRADTAPAEEEPRPAMVMSAGRPAAQPQSSPVSG